MLVVNPWHWLTKDGGFIVEEPRLYRRMFRIARVIEYGGPLQRGKMRETLVECKRRVRGSACLGVMWVAKTDRDEILARCVACRNEEALIHGWQDRDWASGMMDPVPIDERGFCAKSSASSLLDGFALVGSTSTVPTSSVPRTRGLVSPYNEIPVPDGSGPSGERRGAAREQVGAGLEHLAAETGTRDFGTGRSSACTLAIGPRRPSTRHSCTGYGAPGRQLAGYARKTGSVQRIRGASSYVRGSTVADIPLARRFLRGRSAS
jgi:hypothetical protein